MYVSRNKQSNNLNFLSVTVKNQKFISKRLEQREKYREYRNRKEAVKKKEGLEVLFARSESEVIQESASRDSFIMAPLMNFKIAREDRLWPFLHIARCNENRIIPMRKNDGDKKRREKERKKE